MASETLPETIPITTAEIDVLDAGSGDGSVARALFPGARIFRMDIDPASGADFIHDLCEPLPIAMNLSFDVVLCSHVLEHIDRLKVLSAIKTIRSALRYGGLAFLIVPSLEWCAKEILKDKPSYAVLPVLYGAPERPYEAHLTGYTLMLLRQIAGMGGLHVREAGQGDFTLVMAGPEGKKVYIVKQNIVVAMRAEDDPESEGSQ